ncbi:MAG: hypothetical protein ACI8PT_001504 [Gammaproteobacteria bacterium]|jgi:hypothetical protein
MSLTVDIESPLVHSAEVPALPLGVAVNSKLVHLVRAAFLRGATAVISCDECTCAHVPVVRSFAHISLLIPCNTHCDASLTLAKSPPLEM